MSSTGCGPSGDQQSLRQFTLQELELAAKNFNDSNYVGKGTFGLVYKGLLLDGTLVAIKRRLGYPMQEFVEEVKTKAFPFDSVLFSCTLSFELYV